MDEKGFVEGVRRYMSQLREEKRYSSAKSYQDASGFCMAVCRA